MNPDGTTKQQNPAQQRVNKPSPIDADRAQIAARVTSVLVFVAAVVGLTWNAGATYGRLSSAEKTLGEIVPRVEQLRLEQSAQKQINSQAQRRDDQIQRSLERIEAQLIQIREDRR